ncbi:hypothetical protein PCANC_27030 [Puccinia coronata f. sp. avenae]|uniref:Uncharacterized protein n=1 Tax=Puccinia coronata f. sp. avenae TaxID=200324 RepID=A0A2N5TN13_9BASI|nr:hypothetical protein PCANC_27030 [Puccinia coronata f. sp. avenae]
MTSKDQTRGASDTPSGGGSKSTKQTDTGNAGTTDQAATRKTVQTMSPRLSTVAKKQQATATGNASKSSTINDGEDNGPLDIVKLLRASRKTNSPQQPPGEKRDATLCLATYADGHSLGLDSGTPKGRAHAHPHA